MNVMNPEGSEHSFGPDTRGGMPVSPPRVRRKKDGTTRYEKEIAGSPKLADDPMERRWVGSWLMGETIGKGASGRWDPIRVGHFIDSNTVSELWGPGFSF